MEIRVMENIFGANDEKAGEVRDNLTSLGVFMVNLIGSPGAGKTTILERTIAAMGDRYRIAVIEGDVATDRDARRIQRYNVPITLINTDGACHLEALSVEKAIDGLDLANTDLIFIENVGNMVCPAEFDVGEHAKVAVISVTEGDDKPGKYPLLFRESRAIILNKTDLAPYTNFSRDFFYGDVKNLNGSIPIFEVSCTTNTDISGWVSWLESEIRKIKE